MDADSSHFGANLPHVLASGKPAYMTVTTLSHYLRSPFNRHMQQTCAMSHVQKLFVTWGSWGMGRIPGITIPCTGHPRQGSHACMQTD